MCNATSLFLVLLTLVSSLLAQERHSCPQGSHTLYSFKATTLDPASERSVRITSPDGKKEVSARRVEDSKDLDGVHITYTVHTAGKEFETKLLGFNGEVAWSPDAQAFAVTQTEGGGGIGSRVYVFYVDENGLRKLDVSRPIEKHFGTPVRCDVNVVPNTGFVRWEADSSTLLVAAEVVPVSICDCKGTYRVYEVTLPTLTIVRTYSQTEAKSLFWGDLGCELRDASDKCVKFLESH